MVDRETGGIMKRKAVETPKKKQRKPAPPTARRTSVVQRGRVTTQAAPAAAHLGRWTTAYPWDGRQLGGGLVDISQLACECGECWGCMRRLG
jgi:hypothetical protein